jgi:hypothetical protein
MGRIQYRFVIIKAVPIDVAIIKINNYGIEVAIITSEQKLTYPNKYASSFEKRPR